MFNKCLIKDVIAYSAGEMPTTTRTVFVCIAKDLSRTGEWPKSNRTITHMSLTTVTSMQNINNAFSLVIIFVASSTYFSLKLVRDVWIDKNFLLWKNWNNWRWFQIRCSNKVVLARQFLGGNFARTFPEPRIL